MRTEHLVEAQTPAAKARVEVGKSDAAGRVRRAFIRRSGIRVLACILDIIAVSLVTIGLCSAAGYDAWHVPVTTAAPFALLPVLCVAGVWIAGGYRFQHPHPIPKHMFRVALGAVTAMSIVFLAVLVFALDQASLFARLCVANALVVFALHGNYLGVVRTARRNGYVSDNAVTTAAAHTAGQPLPR
jgi:hypothetical protein